MNELLGARAKRARRRADALELAFAEGLLVPWYWLLLKEALFLYLYRREELARAIDAAPEVVRQLQQIRAQDPALFDQLVRDLGQQGLAGVPEVIDGPAVAFLLGRLGRTTFTEGPEPGALIGTALVVALVHLPGLFALSLQRAAENQIDQLGADQQQALRILRTQAQALVPLLQRLAGPRELKGGTS